MSPSNTQLKTTLQFFLNSIFLRTKQVYLWDFSAYYYYYYVLQIYLTARFCHDFHSSVFCSGQCRAESVFSEKPPRIQSHPFHKESARRLGQGRGFLSGVISEVKYVVYGRAGLKATRHEWMRVGFTRPSPQPHPPFPRPLGWMN